MTYRREIDGLRAFAVLSVLLYHANFKLLSGGYLGVDIFFVISGYLITLKIVDQNNQGVFSFYKFYAGRVRRLFPALLSVLVFCSVIFPFYLMPWQLLSLGKASLSSIFGVSNFYFFKHLDYFSQSADMEPLVHTWSLGVEEQFYLFYPMALLLCIKFAKKYLIVIFLIASIFSLFLAQSGGNLNLSPPYVDGEFLFWNPPTWSFYMLFSRAWELLLGAGCAVWGFPKTRRFTNNISSLIGLSLIVGSIFLLNENFQIPGIVGLFPVAGTCIVILFAKEHTIVARILGMQIFVSIGLISYSLYLWHQPVFVLLRINELETPPAMIAGIGAVFLLSFLTWKYIEQPFRNPNFISRKIFSRAASAGLGVTLTCSIVFIATNGFYIFYKIEDHDLLNAANRKLQGEYNNKRFNRLILNEFTTLKNHNVVVVGDSFAKDFVNALYESGISKSFDISTYNIPAHCGNIVLAKKEFKKYLSPSLYSDCLQYGWFDNQKLEMLLSDADLVFFGAHWLDWQLDLIEKGLANFSDRYGEKYIVLGTKGVKEPDLSLLLSMELNERYQATTIPGRKVSAINNELATLVDPKRFINVQHLICGSDKSCRIFSDDGKIISYDGGHLTKNGALFLGNKLRTHPILRQYIN